MRTRDQVRAERAHALVSQIQTKSLADQKKYGTMALKLPLLIRTAGLLGALEFVNGRNDEGRTLLGHITSHLVDAGLLGQNQNLMHTTQTSDVTSYLRLTRETLAVLLWHKRFTHSMLGVEQGDEAS